MHTPRLRTVWLMGATAALALSAQAQSYPAEVVKVDKAQQKVTLRHDAIPALGLPAMSMAYRVQDPQWLDKLTPGARLKFDAQKTGGQYLITGLAPEPSR